MNSKTWPEQDAKARFGDFLDACVNDGPQIVTRRGELTAVLVSLPEWQRLCHAARPSLKALLLAEGARTEPPLTPRTPVQVDEHRHCRNPSRTCSK